MPSDAPLKLESQTAGNSWVLVSKCKSYCPPKAELKTDSLACPGCPAKPPPAQSKAVACEISTNPRCQCNHGFVTCTVLVVMVQIKTFSLCGFRVQEEE